MTPPKVLIISHNPFSKVLNNGKTLEAIFSYIPKENIAQLYFSEHSPDFSYCNKYYRVTDKDMIRSCFLFNKKNSVITTNKQNNTNRPYKKIISLFKKKSLELNLFRDLLWKTNLWKSKDLYNWIKTLDLDLIFFVGGGSGFSHDIALYCSKLTDKPLATYFTDDYLIYPQKKSLFDSIQRYRMKCFYKRTVNFSSILFCIGETMSKEYSAYFNKQFHSIMNLVTVQQYEPYKENSPLIISYFGGLHLNRWKMILRLSTLINKKACINIYSVNHPSKNVLDLFQKHNINFKGSLEENQLKKEMLSSDILLHVESDDPKNKSLTKLSISTKIPEYLITGRVVIGFGPEDVASIKLLKDNKIGIVLSSNESDISLSEKLHLILSDFDYRKNIGEKGYIYAVTNFNKDLIAKNFALKLIKISNCNK